MSAREVEPLLVVNQSSQGHSNWTSCLMLVAFVAVFGGSFQFGYTTGVINQPAIPIRNALSGCNSTAASDASTLCAGSHTVSKFDWSLVVSLFAIGGLLGGLSAGPLTARIGRRSALLLNNVWFVLGSLLMGFASNVDMLIAGRFVVGIGGGAATVVVPMYLAEVSPVEVRGAVGVLNQLAITSGILISQILGLEELLGTEQRWRFLLGMQIVPAVIQLVLLWFCPQSPRWLFFNRKDKERAAASLLRLRNGQEDMVDGEIRDLEAEMEAAADSKTLTILDIVRHPVLWKVLLVGIGLQGCQQLSGINAIFYFSTSVFQNAGISNTRLATTMVGVLNVCLTVVTVYMVDRFGRKRLLQIGMGGMASSFGILTVSLVVSGLDKLTVAMVMFTVVFFAVAPGPIPFLMVAEMFPPAATAAAVSASIGCNWLLNFVIGFTFESMADALGKYAFLPFVGSCFLFFLFCCFLVPETKQKSVPEVLQFFSRRTVEL
eukprot:m.101574 g.101574  ORF g.101574 m.101574 type:complete len:490 (-) comp15465_c0_seq4:19-1488(-)